MKHFLKICFLILPLCGSAQSLVSYIPTGTSYLLSVNFAQLDAKSQQQDYSKFLKPLIRERYSYSYYDYDGMDDCKLVDLNALIKSPALFGIDTRENMYIFKSESGNQRSIVYLFRLSDAKTLEARLNMSCDSVFGSRGYTQKRYSGDGISYVQSDMCISIRGSVAIILKLEKYYGEYEEVTDTYQDYKDSTYLSERKADNLKVDSLFYERLNKEKGLDYESEADNFLTRPDKSIEERALQRQRERKVAMLTKRYNVIFDLVEKMLLPRPDNLGSNRNFQKLAEEKHDAFVYVNAFANIYDNLLNPFSRSRMYEEFTSSLGQTPLTKDISSSYAIDFDMGKATVKVLNTYSKAVFPYMKKIYGVSQEKDLFKYIEGTDLIGYASFAANAKELGKFYEDFYHEMLHSMPLRRKEQNYITGVELFVAMLDKEMLFNTLNGRTIFACTGFSDIRVKYTSYDYNDNFEREEKKMETIERQPRLVMASAIGNMENAKKLFRLVSNFTVFTKLKENVIAFYGDKYNPISIYIALTEDALIVTNDENLVMNYSKGLPKDRQLGKDDRKFMSKHNLTVRIYGQKLMQAIQANYLKDARELPWFGRIMSSAGNLEIYDQKPGDEAYTATAVVTLSDTSTNALYQVLRMMSSMR